MPRSSPLCRWLFRLLLIACACGAQAARADDIADVQRLYYAGQAKQAMERADTYIAAHPKDPQMRFLKGVMLTDAGRGPEAIAIFEKITQEYPDIAEPYNNLAALYASSGDYERARTTLLQALRTNPSYATAYENLGDVYAALAAQSYDKAMRFDPRNVTVPPKLTLVRDLYKRSAAPAGAASAATAGAN